MGTNYYARKIPTAEHYEQLKHIVLTKPIWNVTKFIEQMDENIHIGKSSYGWSFIFQYNNGRFYENKEQLSEFLGKCEIRDEYGRIYTWYEFWELVTLSQHQKKHTPERQDFSHYMEIDGLEFLNSEFC